MKPWMLDAGTADEPRCLTQQSKPKKKYRLILFIKNFKQISNQLQDQALFNRWKDKHCSVCADNFGAEV